MIEEGGRRVLDFGASWGAACLGYGHPALAEAVSEAVGNMGAVSLASCAVAHAVGLAEDLLARLPDDRDRRVWFGHAGSDANDAVVRLLEAATPRRGILSFVGAYHGGSAASMSVSGHSSQAHAPARAGLTRLVYPDPYRPQFTPDLVEGALADLDRRFESELAPDEIAAVFIEPIQSDGGLIVPPAGFLKGLEERCRAHGILIVVDEVKVGMGRTGLFHGLRGRGPEPGHRRLRQGARRRAADLRRDRPGGADEPSTRLRHHDGGRQSGLRCRRPRGHAYHRGGGPDDQGRPPG